EKEGQWRNETDQQSKGRCAGCRDEGSACAKDENKRQPRQADGADDSAYSGNCWKVWLIDLRESGVRHNVCSSLAVTCNLQVTGECSILTCSMQVTQSGRASKKTKGKTEAHDFRRSRCAVACTLDLVGDKWSLLVVRDLFRGSATYGELQNSFEGI